MRIKIDQESLKVISRQEVNLNLIIFKFTYIDVND